MTTTIERPTFYEGQVLAASDLQGSLDYARDQDARHSRTLHTWGIATGLDLTVVDGDLQLSAGKAIDSSGACIIVPTKDIITHQDLTAQLTGVQPGEYPIFLVGRRETAQTDQQFGQCSKDGGTRVREDYNIQFAATVGPHWDVTQSLPPIAEGPDDDAPITDRRILLGVAETDGTEFIKFHAHRRRYVGVRADDVESVGGALTLRTAPKGSEDAAMVVLDNTNPEQTLVFGGDDGNGGVKKVFHIDAKGNVLASGTIRAEKVDVGRVLVQTGTLTDGMRVPLPSGVDDDAVSDATVSVHIVLVPRIDLASHPDPSAQNEWICVPEKCRVINEDRQVECVFRWFKQDTALRKILPGVCDYSVVVTVPPNQ